ncbi:MAG: nitroreductase family protein [Pseudomonadales bacterium]|nr:nitroreductase family protein [Pseudomonadales bacterium]
MDFFEAVHTRRSIKHYDKNAQMPESSFQQMMQAVMLSPTSYNIQHWRFVRVTDRQLRQQLQQAAWGQSQVGDASELIILCADIAAWQKNPERYWAESDEETRNILLPMINDFYAGKEQIQRDEAMRSCGMAAQTLMLAAKSLAYDSCPMVGFDVDDVASLINLPQGHVIAMMVAIGKAIEPAHKRSGQLPASQIIMENTF